MSENKLLKISSHHIVISECTSSIGYDPKDLFNGNATIYNGCPLYRGGKEGYCCNVGGSNIFNQYCFVYYLSRYF